MRRTKHGNPLPEPLKALAPVVLVKWRDAVFDSEYCSVTDAEPYLEVYSVGFVLRQDKDGISIGTQQVNSERAEGRMRQVMSIPAAYIVKITELGPTSG